MMESRELSFWEGTGKAVALAKARGKRGTIISAAVVSVGPVAAATSRTAV